MDQGRRTAAEQAVAKVDKHWDAFIATNDMTHLRSAIAAAHESVDSGIHPNEERAVRMARKNGAAR